MIPFIAKGENEAKILSKNDKILLTKTILNFPDSL